MERQGYPKHQYGANYRWHEFLTVYNFAGNFIFYSKMHGYEGLDIGMGKLTTHVLNMAQGKAASGMKIEFSVLEGAVWKLLKTIHTNNDGRTGEPLLADEACAQASINWCFMWPIIFGVTM